MSSGNGRTEIRDSYEDSDEDTLLPHQYAPWEYGEKPNANGNSILRNIITAPDLFTAENRNDRNIYHLILKAIMFYPENITVKQDGRSLTFECKQAERCVDGCWMSSVVVRRIVVPDTVNLRFLETRISNDYTLSVLGVIMPRPRYNAPITMSIHPVTQQQNPRNVVREPRIYDMQTSQRLMEAAYRSMAAPGYSYWSMYPENYDMLSHLQMQYGYKPTGPSQGQRQGRRQNNSQDRLQSYPQGQPEDQYQGHQQHPSRGYQQGHSQDYRQAHSQGYPLGQSQSIPQEYSRGYQQGHNEEYPQGHSQDYQLSSSRGLPEDYSQGRPEGYPVYSEGYPEDHAQGYLQRQSQAYPQAHSQVYPQRHPQDYVPGRSQAYPQGQPQEYVQGRSQTFPQGHPQNYVQGRSQGYPQRHPQDYVQNRSQARPQGHPQEYVQGHPQAYVQGRSLGYQQGHPQNYPQGRSQGHPPIQQRVPMVNDNPAGLRPGRLPPLRELSSGESYEMLSAPQSEDDDEETDYCSKNCSD